MQGLAIAFGDVRICGATTFFVRRLLCLGKSFQHFKILAPIHPLTRRDGPLDHGRDGYWGMNSTAFTNLESLFLFRLLRKHGFADDVFNRISDELKNNKLICEQERFAAGRLGPESLQEHALQLIRDEMPQAASVPAGGQNATANGNATGNTGSLSPTAKKRKLSSLPLPTLKDAREQADRVIPVLLAVLQERYKQQMVRAIQEDDDKILNLQREIAELEKKESARAVVQQQPQPQPQPTVQPERKIAATNGTPTPSTEEPKSAKPFRPNGQVTQTPIPVPTPPQLQPQSTAANKPATPAPVSQPPLPQDRRPVQPNPSTLPPNVRPPSEVRQTTPVSRPSEPPRPPSAASSGLQHPQAAQGYGLPQPSASPQPHFPEGNLQRPESLPRTQTPGPRPRPSPQPQTPSTLQWEPPYRPQHQTPVPSPRPPYAPQQNVRQPGYPNQAQAGHSPQQQQHQYPPPPNYAANRQAPPPVTQPPQPSRTPTPGTTQAPQSVLVPPQHAGQLPPSLGSLPLNATPDGSGQQPPQHRPAPVIPSTGPPTSASPAPAPAPAPHFPQAQAYQYPAQQAVRPPSSAAQQVSTPVRAPSVILPTSQRPAVPNQPQPPPRQFPPPAPPAPSTPVAKQPDTSSKPRGPPYPGHLSGRAEQPQHQTPGQPRAPLGQPISQTPSAVHTPVHTPSGSQLISHVVRGHGTKWTSTPTPATPRMEMTGYFDVASPSYEPLSPPSQHAQLPKSSSQHSAKKESRKSVSKIDPAASRPKSRLSQSAHIAEDPADDLDTPARAIKNEEATPKAFDDLGGEGGLMIPRSTKRKREESPEEAASSEPPTHVLWTRAFQKVSAQALEQVTSHKHANMFAGPVKVRDAPNYSDIVLQPMDLKKIRAAIHQGQRHAQNVEKTLSDIDPSAMNVWLPTSADLVPPRAILNIAQLERELVHMFANATMYAMDPDRGFGPEFVKKRGEDDADDDEGVLGYEVDENGIVKQTRNMFMEVEKLLGDLRSEVERNAQPAGVPPLSRSVSMVGGEATAGEEEDEQADDDAPSVAKRRRVRG
ncbi:hypothetical protein PG985_008349 [Apiospora marii]|uniref:uncharacterized protein n=1 Tax=Apiospora marii TaxID=335849 RepID=UPI003130322E